MKSKTTFATLAGLSLLVLLSVVALRQPRQVKAQDEVASTVPDRIWFPMVGITQGQTARINVTNISSAICPCSRVVLTFRGPNGQLIRNQKGEVIRRAVELAPGDSTFLDVDYGDLPPGPIRLQLRAGITFLPPTVTDSDQVLPRGNSGRQVPPPLVDNIVSTVEVINNADGRTQFAVFTNPAVLRGFNPQPDPPRLQ
jgi:hypothetical protein